VTADTSLLSIGEVAARAGLRTSALRYYEAEGLLPADARVGGRRRYAPEAVERLTLIRFCQALGFTLDEIRAILAPPRGPAQKARWRGLVDAKLADLAGAVERAEAMMAILRTSRECDCIDVQECAARASATMGPRDGADADR
jgi:MerR family transcriptional regulator, redox-sensitive transcriptional activator SoxR